MKKAVYWLMGERTGRVLTASWNWLWGLPVEAGGKIAVEVGKESLQSMQQAVAQLTASVAQVTASYERSRQKYHKKQQELQSAQQQAQLAYQQGNEEAARLAMTKVITIERSLPQLAAQVEKAQTLAQAAQEKLKRERQRLETYKLEMENLKDLSEVNEALASISKVCTDLDIDSARSQFETAQSAIERRHFQVNAELEFAENPTEILQAELDQMTMDDEITRRLKQLPQMND